MKKHILLTVLLLFSATILTSAQSDMPTLGDLDEGWNLIETDGFCSAGDPYHFFANVSDASDDLLIFFDGGGACWTGQQCNIDIFPNIHEHLADPEVEDDVGGIFDLDNARNPVVDYSMVFIPYCTGDVFVGGGAREYSYPSPDGEVTISVNHTGYTNTQTVLDWVYDNFDTPEHVIVSGSSGGAIGSSFFSGFIAEQYTDVPVLLVADAAGGYGSPNIARTFNAWDTASILPDWEGYEGKDNDNLTFEDFYVASALHADNLTIAQYNAAFDSTQISFQVILGDPLGTLDLSERIFEHYAEIEALAGIELFTYTAGGDTHTILPTDRVYTYTVEGVRFIDWFTALINGDDAGDVSCTNDDLGCDVAPD